MNICYYLIVTGNKIFNVAFKLFTYPNPAHRIGRVRWAILYQGECVRPLLFATFC